MEQRKYKVINKYRVHGESDHRTPEAALKARGRREGVGWMVIDDNGNFWDYTPGG